jgi:hypothetical protein
MDNNIYRWVIIHTATLRTAFGIAATITDIAQKTIHITSMTPTTLLAITITTPNFLQEPSQG